MNLLTALLVAIIALFIFNIEVFLGSIEQLRGPTRASAQTEAAVNSSQPTNAGSAVACKVPEFSSYISKYDFYPVNGKTSFISPKNFDYEQQFLKAKEIASKWSKEFGVDPALAVMWVFAETGGKKDSYSYSNCLDRTYDLENACSAVGSGQWQLGYGQQFDTYKDSASDPRLGIRAAFKKIHGEPSDASLTKKVGDEVLKNAGQNRQFPSTSLNDLLTRGVGDMETRYWISVLMRDPQISMYLLSSALQSFNRETAFRWGGYYSSKWQDFSNLMNEVVEVWNSTACNITSGAQTSSSLSSQVIKSNNFITKVGNPPGPAPAGFDSPTGSVTGTIGSGPLGFTLTCPLDPQGNNFKVSCGTAAYPVGNCGHGHPQFYQACKAPPYAACPNGGHSEALRKSIDVVLRSTGDAANAPLYFPFVNGNQTVKWTKVSGPIAIAGGSWGYKSEFTTEFNGKQLKLDLTHINSQTIQTGNSGDIVGSVYSGTDGPGSGHLHALVYVDGKPVETEKEAFMCSNESPLI